jgi:hypothetical protein
MLLAFPMAAFAPYGLPWIAFDAVAGINLLAYLSYMVFKLRKLEAFFLTPVWWFFTGISVYIALYYLKTGHWYFTPKCTEMYEETPSFHMEMSSTSSKP